MSFRPPLHGSTLRESGFAKGLRPDKTEVQIPLQSTSGRNIMKEKRIRARLTSCITIPIFKILI